jgi:hypothetical protein
VERRTGRGWVAAGGSDVGGGSDGGPTQASRQMTMHREELKIHKPRVLSGRAGAGLGPPLARYVNPSWCGRDLHCNSQRGTKMVEPMKSPQHQGAAIKAEGAIAAFSVPAVAPPMPSKPIHSQTPRNVRLLPPPF